MSEKHSSLPENLLPADARGLTEYQLSIGRCGRADGSGASGPRWSFREQQREQNSLNFPGLFFRESERVQHMLIMGPGQQRDHKQSASFTRHIFLLILFHFPIFPFTTGRLKANILPRSSVPALHTLSLLFLHTSLEPRCKAKGGRNVEMWMQFEKPGDASQDTGARYEKQKTASSSSSSGIPLPSPTEKAGASSPLKV